MDDMSPNDEIYVIDDEEDSQHDGNSDQVSDVNGILKPGLTRCLDMLLNVDVVSLLSMESIKLMMEIFENIFIDNPPEYLNKNLLDKNDQIQYEIDVRCFIKVLNLWRLFPLASTDTPQFYEEFFKYLKKNMRNVKLLANEKYLNVVKRCKKLGEDIFVTSCTFKELQVVIFNMSLNLSDNKVFYIPARMCVTLPRDIQNWPFISIEINLHSFNIIHQNRNCNEFSVVRPQDNYSSPQNDYTSYQENHACGRTNKTNLYYRRMNQEEPNQEMKNQRISQDCFSSTLIVTFLNQLIIDVSKYKSISMMRKLEIIKILTELIKDVDSFCGLIQINTEYFIDANPHPYVRHIEYNDKINHNVPMVARMRQVTRPVIGFILKKFEVPHTNHGNGVVFNFPDTFLCDLSNSILYKCTMCDEALGPRCPSQMINNHLLKYHGHESDWECPICGLKFSTNYLSKVRWSHDCNKQNHVNR